MQRLGIISELGTGGNLGFCRVYFDEEDMVSAWIPLPSVGTKTAKHWQPVEVGSQVACLMDDECEQGAVVAVLWSDTDTPPNFANEHTVGIQFADGAKLYYDSQNSKLFFDKQNAEIEIVCSKLKLTGDLDITGTVDATGSITSKQTVEGLQVTETATQVTLGTHIHPTLIGPTSPPIPGT